MKTFLKKHLWYPDYPIRLPYLWLKKSFFPTAYEKWLQHTYPELEKKILAGQKVEAFASEQPLSVVTLVYNPKVAHFKALIQCMENQSLSDYEWILVENGSTDPQILSLLKSMDGQKGCRVIYPGRPLGIAQGTALGVKEARHRWIAFVDHDDTIAPHALEYLSRAATSRPEVEFIYTNSDHTSSVGQRFGPMIKPGPSPEYILTTNYITHFHMIQKEVFLKLWDTSPQLDGSQDWDLTLKALHQCSCYHLPLLLYSHRVHPSQFSASLFRQEGSEAKTKIKDSLFVVMLNFLKAQGLDHQFEVVAGPRPGTLRLWPQDVFLSPQDVERERQLIQAQAPEARFIHHPPSSKIRLSGGALKNILGIFLRNPGVSQVYYAPFETQGPLPPLSEQEDLYWRSLGLFPPLQPQLRETTLPLALPYFKRKQSPRSGGTSLVLIEPAKALLQDA